jgi:hypothetical protein
MSTVLHATKPAIAWIDVFWGGLLIALGDMTFATFVWFSWSAAGLTRLFQSIAVGVLGKASFDGGLAAALLGAALHLFIATMFVTVYTGVAQRHPSLLRTPVVHGALYGVVLYGVMNFVVMPLSRVHASPSFAHPYWIGFSVIAHMVFGVICVLFARRALRHA